MRAKLRLVKAAAPIRAEAKEREIRYRFPAEEEVWEVSCQARLPRQRQPRSVRSETRRAS
jgi:hypothetical protein